MGQPAARMGDMTNHAACIAPIPSPTGKIIPPCCTTGLIGDSSGSALGGSTGSKQQSSGSSLGRVLEALSPISSAQAEEADPEVENRGLLEEFIDPLAEVRIAEFDAILSKIREVDPHNPELSYVEPSNSVPSNETISRASEALREAVLRNLQNQLMPGGKPIGQQGNGRDIRVVPGGGLPGAQQLFDSISKGGTVRPSPHGGTLVLLPENVGYVGIRLQTSTPGSPAVDVDVPGIPFTRVHY